MLDFGVCQNDRPHYQNHLTGTETVFKLSVPVYQPAFR